MNPSSRRPVAVRASVAVVSLNSVPHHRLRPFDRLAIQLITTPPSPDEVPRPGLLVLNDSYNSTLERDHYSSTESGTPPATQRDGPVLTEVATQAEVSKCQYLKIISLFLLAAVGMFSISCIPFLIFSAEPIQKRPLICRTAPVCSLDSDQSMVPQYGLDYHLVSTVRRYTNT